ncbi:hypothetical protein M8J76_010916 [Diaphorina citri]|nr:hypothetical protein M8J76_010916 [Diaphorina citri]
MPASRHKIVTHVFSGFCDKMSRTKQLDPSTDLMETPLKRCLNTFDITLLGTVARDLAGPGIILSFMLAGITSMLAAVCYAEFGARVPKAGSAYVYTYVSVGEFWAFVIGWNIILEHMIGAASVARAWSGYVDSLCGGAISNFTIATVGELHEDLLGKYPDFLAFFVCLGYALLLGMGVKGSAFINSFLTLANLMVMAIVIVVGFYYGRLDNWINEGGGFLPYGISGVVAGAATCFYAYVGFDSIATSGEEAKDPAYSIPLATILSMSVVALGYILVSAALTLMIPYWTINPNAALPEAFSMLGLHWLKYTVTFGALCGMTTTLFGSLFSLPRCIYAMAEDGLIFKFLGKVNRTTQVPVINLAISGFFSAIIALLFDLEKLVEFMSIGTLLAYTIVSASVIILRYRPAITGLGSRDASHLTLTPEAVTPQSVSTLDFELGAGGTLKTGWQYNWMNCVLGRFEPGVCASLAVFIYICMCAGLCFHLHAVYQVDQRTSWWSLFTTTMFVFCMCACLFVIEAHEQNMEGLRFKVPLVPFVPGLSIFFNIELMANLNVLTWLRFIIWMALGLLVYFLYGIHHSKEQEVTSSYKVLLTSNEAVKLRWGAIPPRRRTKSPDDDTRPIVDSD